ncbi:MAG: nucleotidyltransferase domain-containing protein [Propionicimonas sp.]
MRDSLTQVANRTDLAVATARAELEAVVRAAAAEGMTQQEIARAIGRSQPEVSRLLHFHGRSPLGRRLRKRAVDVRRLVAEAGGSNVRVFGSVAKGSDRQGSDIDLLFSMNHPLSLLELGTLERRIGDLVGAEVDLVPEAALRPDLRERALSEAVPL